MKTITEGRTAKMNDLYTTAINTQKATKQWMDVLAENMTNYYTPGFRENKITFKTFLGGAIVDNKAEACEHIKSAISLLSQCAIENQDSTKVEESIANLGVILLDLCD